MSPARRVSPAFVAAPAAPATARPRGRRGSAAHLLAPAVWVLALTATGGCAQEVTHAEGSPSKAAAAEPGTLPVAAPGTAAAPATPASPAVPAASPAAAAGAGPDAVAAAYVDPPWFRADALPGKLLKQGRSEADAQGRFSSLLLIELDEGATVEGCVEQAKALVKDAVPELERTDATDRVQLTGTAERYRVSFVCGAANGRVRASLNLQWFR